MADAPANPPDRTAGRTLDTATRERLLRMLQEELARASGEALDRGVSPEALAAQLDERIARLRTQIADLGTDQNPPDHRPADS